MSLGPRKREKPLNRFKEYAIMREKIWKSGIEICKINMPPLLQHYDIVGLPDLCLADKNPAHILSIC